MVKNDNYGNNTGCFAWLIRAKRSVNERWARTRNAFRKKFARDNSKELGAEDYVNETGKPDMVISKVSIKPETEEKLVPDRPIKDIYEAAIKESFTHIIDENNVERKMIKGEHSTSSLSSGAISDIANAAVQESMTNIIEAIRDEGNTVVQTISVSSLVSGISGPTFTCESAHNIFEDVRDDNKAVIDEGSTGSLSSGAISLLAEAAVTASLSQLTQGENNEDRKSTPRSVAEMYEFFNIDPKIGLLDATNVGLPRCSP